MNNYFRNPPEKKRPVEPLKVLEAMCIVLNKRYGFGRRLEFRLMPCGAIPYHCIDISCSGNVIADFPFRVGCGELDIDGIGAARVYSNEWLRDELIAQVNRYHIGPLCDLVSAAYSSWDSGIEGKNSNLDNRKITKFLVGRGRGERYLKQYKSRDWFGKTRTVFIRRREGMVVVTVGLCEPVESLGMALDLCDSLKGTRWNRSWAC